MFDGYVIGYLGNALPPIDDGYAGAITTDVFNMKHYAAGAFIIIQGAIEDSGASNIVTIQACDDTTPTNNSTMLFRHRSYVETTDLWGALTDATATGKNFNNAAAVSNGIYTCEFTAAEVFADGANGYTYVRCAVAETVNKTVGACILFAGLIPRYLTSAPSGART